MPALQTVSVKQKHYHRRTALQPTVNTNIFESIVAEHGNERALGYGTLLREMKPLLVAAN